MKPLPTLPGPRSKPHQLSIPLNASKLRGLSRAERDAAVGALAGLLLEAADGAEAENDDECV